MNALLRGRWLLLTVVAAFPGYLDWTSTRYVPCGKATVLSSKFPHRKSCSWTRTCSCGEIWTRSLICPFLQIKWPPHIYVHAIRERSRIIQRTGTAMLYLRCDPSNGGVGYLKTAVIHKQTTRHACNTRTLRPPSRAPTAFSTRACSCVVHPKTSWLA